MGQNCASMSLAVRLQKAKFIVEELQVAFYLTRYSPNDFTARILARHVLVRAENFIFHMNSLRKPLSRAHFPLKDFLEKKRLLTVRFF